MACKVRVVKNKVAPPFKEVEFDIIYGEGVSRDGDLLDLAANSGIIEKSGSWFTYGTEKIGQGRETAKQYLKDNPKFTETLHKKVLEHYGIGAVKAAAPEKTEVKEKKKS